MLTLLSYLNAVLERERFVEFHARMVQLAPTTEEAVMRYSDAMIEQGREQGLEQGLERGRTEGREQGRTEGQRAALTKLLTLKFGALDRAIAARIEAASSPEVDRALDRLLAAETPASVFDP
jgi:flagellar biosynthesis/type III secretory pathway protein FliH